MMRFRREIVKQLEDTYSWANIWAMEVATPMTDKLLPGCRIFVPLGAPTNLCGPYVYNASGIMQIVHAGGWGFYDGDEYATCTACAKFYTSRELLVRNEDEATQTAKLIEDLESYGGVGPMLLWNTRGFTLFRPDNIQSLVGFEQNWRFRTKKTGQDWLITREYVGPPASIMVPPVWVLTTDSTGMIVDVKQRVSWGFP